jgi:hypothetical protein
VFLVGFRRQPIHQFSQLELHHQEIRTILTYLRPSLTIPAVVHPYHLADWCACTVFIHCVSDLSLGLVREMIGGDLLSRFPSRVTHVSKSLASLRHQSSRGQSYSCCF